MTSPPRRPIISLKFKTPVPTPGDSKPAEPTKPAFPVKPTAFVMPDAAAKQGFAKPTPTKPASAKPARSAATPRAAAPAQPAAAPKAAPKPEPAKKSGPAISPEVFKAAIRAAGLAIQNVVADPEWKSEDLLHQYQAAKDSATSTHKQQAKLVSTVATRRHAKDIEQAGVESAAMRAAYAAALVALVTTQDKHEEVTAGEP